LKTRVYLVLTATYIKVKVKVTLVQALRLCTGRTAHRGSRGIALLLHDHVTRRGEGSASRPVRSLPPGRPGTHCTGGWLGPRAGLDRCGKSRPPDRPARSQSLYRLRHPAYSHIHNATINRTYCCVAIAAPTIFYVLSTMTCVFLQYEWNALLHFYGNDVYANASQSYVTLTVRCLVDHASHSAGT
jgi:hypothetical protein